MKYSIVSFILFSFFVYVSAQSSIDIQHANPGDVVWIGDEKEFYSEIWQTQVLTNVSNPSIEVYLPKSELNTGTGVIIAPGGALYAHSIESEGREIARWLNEKGIAAFVLKYRLVPTGENGVAELGEVWNNDPLKMRGEVGKVLPHSVSDALNTISYVRENAADFGVDSNKIGIMGFSAGGAVVLGVANYYTKENRPDFLVPVYPWIEVMSLPKPKKDTPPVFVVCASDDQVVDISGTIKLVNTLHSMGMRPALCMYSKGSHGFGMRKQGLPSDHWIERFYEWAIAEKLTSPVE